MLAGDGNRFWAEAIDVIDVQVGVLPLLTISRTDGSFATDSATRAAPFESVVVAEDCSPFFCNMTVAPAML